MVYNGANAMELDFVEDYSQIKSVLWCPGAGQTGFDALGEILRGKVNPSGKTTDTFVQDLTRTPSFYNMGYLMYDNMEEFECDNYSWPTTPSFVNYTENIYVGYRFYETAAAENAIRYDVMPAMGAKNGLELQEFRGVSYEDEKWELLLDQMSVEEMDALTLAGIAAMELVKMRKYRKREVILTE